MAIRIGCCLNLPPPTPTNNSSFPPKPSQLPIWKKSGEEGPRRLPCAIMIGLEMAILTSTSSINYAYAAESQYDVVRGGEAEASMVRPLEAETTSHSHSQPPRTRTAPSPKWSDTIRTCPAWRVNSLESVVPENLPRPSFRRRAEAASYAAAGAAGAPAVKFSVSGGCFSM